MVVKPVRLLGYLFSWTWRCKRFNSIPNILILLTNKSVALFYSITIRIATTTTTKVCVTVSTWFHNQSSINYSLGGQLIRTTVSNKQTNKPRLPITKESRKMKRSRQMYGTKKSNSFLYIPCCSPVIRGQHWFRVDWTRAGLKVEQPTPVKTGEVFVRSCGQSDVLTGGGSVHSVTVQSYWITRTAHLNDVLVVFETWQHFLDLGTAP